MGYWLGPLGAWVFSDGLYSLLTHTRPPLSQHQSWLRDHSFRLVRMACGLALVVIGWQMPG